MHPPNADRIIDLVREDARVLDVGGWYQPFNRADVVVDLLPYETRGLGGHCGPGPERFNECTWITQDICRTPLPFPDDSFDFVVCSHTLEDVRDPVFVCSELVRVARRGYIEVPSRAMESVQGLEGRHYAGYYHHRWLVEIEGEEIRFRFKPHAIHEDRRYHLPRRHLRRLSPAARVQWLFWERSFSYAEVIQISHVQTRRELASFVQRTAPIGLPYRAAAIIKAPLTARQYRTWRALLHPLDIHVAADSPEGESVWNHMPDIESR